MPNPITVTMSTSVRIMDAYAAPISRIEPISFGDNEAGGGGTPLYTSLVCGENFPEVRAGDDIEVAGSRYHDGVYEVSSVVTLNSENSDTRTMIFTTQVSESPREVFEGMASPVVWILRGARQVAENRDRISRYPANLWSVEREELMPGEEKELHVEGITPSKLRTYGLWNSSATVKISGVSARDENQDPQQSLPEYPNILMAPGGCLAGHILWLDKIWLTCEGVSTGDELQNRHIGTANVIAGAHK